MITTNRSFLKCYKCIALLLGVFLLFIHPACITAQTLDFSLSKDTLNVRDSIVITNTSTGFNQNSRFLWTVSSEFFFVNDTINSKEIFTTGIIETIIGRFIHDGPCLITIKAIDSLGNVITGIPFHFESVYVMPSMLLVCTNVTCNDPQPWSLCEHICNGDFEWSSDCPLSDGELCLAQPWTISLFGSSTSSSPDFYDGCFGSCAVPPWSCFGVPENWITNYLDSHNGGDAYAGFWAIDMLGDPINGYREYIQQPLKFPMVGGNTYFVTMYISHAGRSDLACDKIRMYFSSNQIVQPGLGMMFTSIIPSQLSVPTGIISANDTWSQYSTSFTAPLGTNLQWVTIGVFDAKSNLSITDSNHDQANFPVSYIHDGAYYHIDDVSIISANPIIEILPSQASYCVGQSITFAQAEDCITLNSWLWDFGDGTTSTGQSITHTYTTSGTYSVSLSVTDLLGNHYSSSETIYVYEASKPDFSGYFNTCHGNTSYTVNNYTGSPDVWSYGIDQGGTYTQLGVLTSSTFSINWSIYPLGGILIVSHFDSHGCKSSDSLMVFPCCTTGTVFTDCPISGIQDYTNVSINGTVTIMTGASIGFLNNVFMGGNAKVIIDQGASVSIKNCLVNACGSYMWDGFYLINSSSTITVSGSTIRDAKCAVVSQLGGLYQIDNSTFNMNYKHLYLGPYNGTHAGYVKNTDFICNAPLFPQYPPVNATQTKICIEVLSVKSVQIGSTFAALDENYFTQADIGVSSTNSCVTVYNNRFENFILGSPFPGQIKGIGMYSTYLPQLQKYATTYLYAGDLNTSTLFRSNSFTNCTNGIYSYNTEGFVINYNTFNNSGLPASQKGTAVKMDEPIHATGTIKQIKYNTISNVIIGINLNLVNQAFVIGNNISGLLIQNYAQATGIKMDGNNSNTISCNVISNTSVGTYTYGIRGNLSLVNVNCNTITRMHNGIYFSGTSNPSTLIRNSMNYCNYGIHLSYGGIIGQQGNASYSNSNSWTGSAFFDLYTSVNTDGFNSRYYYNGYNPSSGTSSINPIPKSVATNGSQTMCRCVGINSVMPDINIFSQENYQEMEDIVNGTVPFATLETESQEISKQSVYSCLKYSNMNPISQNLQNFVLENASGDYGKMEQVDQIVCTGDAILASDINSTITEGDKTVKTIKEVNAILLNSEINPESNYFLFTPNELQVLKSIAAQCPYEYGYAVFMARAALSSIDPMVYENLCEVEGQFIIDVKSISQNDTIENSVRFKIFPNPANTELYIECTEVLDVNAELQNSIGELVYRCKLQNIKNVINLDDFSPGLYNLRIIRNGLTLHTEKFTIVR